MDPCSHPPLQRGTLPIEVSLRCMLEREPEEHKNQAHQTLHILSTINVESGLIKECDTSYALIIDLGFPTKSSFPTTLKSPKLHNILNLLKEWFRITDRRFQIHASRAAKQCLRSFRVNYERANKPTVQNSSFWLGCTSTIFYYFFAVRTLYLFKSKSHKIWIDVLAGRDEKV